MKRVLALAMLAIGCGGNGGGGNGGSGGTGGGGGSQSCSITVSGVVNGPVTGCVALAIGNGAYQVGMQSTNGDFEINIQMPGTSGSWMVTTTTADPNTPTPPVVQVVDSSASWGEANSGCSHVDDSVSPSKCTAVTTTMVSSSSLAPQAGVSDPTGHWSGSADSDLLSASTGVLVNVGHITVSGSF